MQDPSARLTQDPIRGRRRFLLLPAGLRLRLRALRLRLRRRREPQFRLGERSQRRLAAMDRALVTEAPGLASLFVMFNQLGDGVNPAGPERVPPPSRRRPQRVHVVALLILAAVAALCYWLSATIHAPAAPCAAGAGASTSTSASAVPAVSPLDQELNCSAYAGNK